MFNLQLYRKQVNKLLMQYQMVYEQFKQEQSNVETTKQKALDIIEAQTIVQLIAQTLQQRANEKISKIVTRCLNTVFLDPYDFYIQFEAKRGKTETTMKFNRDGVELDDPLNEVGGGVIDVTTLALRLARILLSKPTRRRIVILDEPFKNIRGEDNKEKTREMLLELAKELGFQFVINTEIESYQLGTVIELGK